ncbi:MAG TPA: hypothetical protein VF749_08635 [Candidatus Acidoferrum sp.]
MNEKNKGNRSPQKLTRRDVLRLLAATPAFGFTAGSLAAEDSAITARANAVRQIIVVCKTHFDIGYSHRVKDVVAYYRTTMIDRALEVTEQAKELPPQQRFVWTSPGWVMQKVLEDWDGQTAERRRKLDAAMRSRQFVTHAMPFSVEAELLEPEEFARGYMFADAVSRRYGLALAEGAKTTDVPSQSPSLATGLAHGGVKFMHIGCNWPSGYVHNMPPLFWWEGPDGSRVLTMYSSIYGTCTAFWPWGGTDDPYIGHNLLPPANWPYKTWVAIIVTGDNSGPPAADGVKSIFAEAAEKLPGVDVRMGTMEEFADAILAEKPRLPIVKGETPDTWIHGCMCDPGGMRLARNCRPLMSAVEVLSTQLRCWGLPLADPMKELAEAYEQSLLYSEHTWGRSTSVNVYGAEFRKLPESSYKDLEDSWEDKTDYIRNAAKITESILGRDLGALAHAVDWNGPRVVVYNALPWPRSGVVDMDGRAFFADEVPACGYKTFLVPAANESTTSTDDTLENEFFEVRLDPTRGRIASLRDKHTGRQWVDDFSEFGLGQYLNERFELAQTDGYCRDYQQGRWGSTLHDNMRKPGLPSEVHYRAASGHHGSVRSIKNRDVTTAILDMPGDPANHLPATSLGVSLHRARPFLDLELTIIDKAKDNWPEADWLCLPFKVSAPQFSVWRNLGIMDPARDILSGANRHLYAVGLGITITGADGASISLCPLDHPLISLDTPGIWRFSLDFVPKKPTVFLNLYNNQWNTNYRYWYPGTWSSRVRVWFGNDLAVPALEGRVPLLAATAAGPGGKLPAVRGGVSVSRPGVLVTAFGSSPALKGTLLRIWEVAGKSGKIVVKLPSGTAAKTAQPVDLRGRPRGLAIPTKNDSFEVQLRAFAPASFELVSVG